MEGSEIVKTLQELYELANEACERISEDNINYNEAINWGDLGCLKVRYCITRYGHNYYEVIIAEAAPDAIELRAAIKRYIQKHSKIMPINVVTE